MIIGYVNNGHGGNLLPIESAVRLGRRGIVGRNDDQPIGLADVCRNLPFTLPGQFVPMSRRKPKVFQANRFFQLLNPGFKSLRATIAERFSSIRNRIAVLLDSFVGVGYFHRQIFW